MPAEPRKRLTRQEQQQRTREQLLAAAEDVFSSRGFAAATLEEISEQAGYSRTAVYKHFANKDELFIAIMDSRAEASLASLEETAERELADSAQLAMLGDHIAAQIVDRQPWIVACLEFTAHVRDVPQLRERALRAQRDADEQSARFIAQLCGSLGVEAPMPPEQLAVTLWSVANGLAIRALIDDELDIARTFSDAFNAILAGGATSPTGADNSAAEQKVRQR